MTKNMAKQDAFVAIVLSLIVCLYFAEFGSKDFEESTKISYTIAANSHSNGGFDSPRQIGTYTFLGVPLYDGLQGTGNRLPYQASWAQSPEWPLRFVLDKPQYLLMRVFFASLVMMMPALAACRSWRPRVSTFQQLIFGLLLLSPVGVYLRWNEWSDTYSQTAAITGIIFLLMRRCNFLVSENQIEMIVQSKYDFLVLFGCVALLISGHPGVWPIAVFVIVPLVLVASCLSNPFRERLWLTVRYQKRMLIIVLMPALVLICIVVWELASESVGLPGWAQARREQTQGFYAEQGLRGFTRGLLPDFLERSISVVIATMLLPLIRVLALYLPTTDFSSRTSVAFPRGEFAGFLAVAAAIFSWKRFRRTTPEGMLLWVVAIGQIASVSLAVAAANDLLPLTITPSGAWQMFPTLIPLNVLVTYVLLGLRRNIHFLSVVLTSLNIFSTGLWVAMQLSFLTISSQYEDTNLRTAELAIPNRENQIALSIRDTMEMKPLLATTGRMLFLQSGEYDPQTNWPVYIKVVEAGKPVVVPADPKIRNANQLIRHSTTSGTIASFKWAKDDVVGLDRLLDFLEVEQVLIEAHDPIAGTAADFVARVNQRNSRSDKIGVMTFSGVDYILWSRSQFSSSIISEDVAIDPERCPVLETICPITSQTTEAFPSKTPRLNVCDDPCLWTFSTGRIAPGETLVVPVTYSDTLVVRGTDRGGLQTVDVGGFLGVMAELGLEAGTYELTVRPDLRMYARVFASYAYLVSFLLLVLFLVSRRRMASLATAKG